MLNPEEHAMWRAQELVERNYRHRLEGGECTPQGRLIVIQLHEEIGIGDRVESAAA